MAGSHGYNPILVPGFSRVAHADLPDAQSKGAAVVTEKYAGLGEQGLRERAGTVLHACHLLKPLQYMRSWWRRDLRIVAYHRVLSTFDADAFEFDLDLVSASAAGFREQMLLLKRRFNPMRLGDVVKAVTSGQSVSANAVVVTFDDGYDDNYRVAYPILRELGVPATFFVSTGNIDSGLPYDYDWLVHMLLAATQPRITIDELAIDVPAPSTRISRRPLVNDVLRRLKMLDGSAQTALIARLASDWRMPREQPHPNCQPMNWQQLREMHAAGFEIGSHGVHHRMLAKLPQQELEFELRESKAVLERELGAPASLIAYPVGGYTAFDDRVIDATISAGYQAACSYVSGTNSLTGLRQYDLRRLAVERDMRLGWFDAMLTLPEWLSYTTSKHGNDSAHS
ncbi:MAG TPA: polysaccharide deacetylase family protein [Rhodanobacter sp.]|nr:polysaccharide deacetylase family protein [Rhodanobacter sp.]